MGSGLLHGGSDECSYILQIPQMHVCVCEFRKVCTLRDHIPVPLGVLCNMPMVVNTF